MDCRGIFIFKSIKKKDGGSFTLPSGQVVNYKERMEVTFDEILEDGMPKERTTKVDMDKTELIKKLEKIKMYERIVMVFESGWLSNGNTYMTLLDVGSEAKQPQQ